MIPNARNILCCFRELPLRRYCLKVSLLFWIITCLIIYQQPADAVDGNMNAQELADPLYRQLGIPLFRSIGHTALYAGMDNNDHHKVLEMQLGKGVQVNTLESMSNDPKLGYWGAYNSSSSNRPLTFADRHRIIIIARTLDNLRPRLSLVGIGSIETGVILEATDRAR